MQFIHDRIVRIRAGWKNYDAVQPCCAVFPTAVVAAGVCMCGVRGHLWVSAGGLTASRLSRHIRCPGSTYSCCCLIASQPTSWHGPRSYEKVGRMKKWKSSSPFLPICQTHTLTPVDRMAGRETCITLGWMTCHKRPRGPQDAVCHMTRHAHIVQGYARTLLRVFPVSMCSDTEASGLGRGLVWDTEIKPPDAPGAGHYGYHTLLLALRSATCTISSCLQWLPWLRHPWWHWELPLAKVTHIHTHPVHSDTGLPNRWFMTFWQKCQFFV